MSQLEVVTSPSYVRFTLRSGAIADMPISTLWATTGLMHRNRRSLFHHLVGGCEEGPLTKQSYRARLAANGNARPAPNIHATSTPYFLKNCPKSKSVMGDLY